MPDRIDAHRVLADAEVQHAAVPVRGVLLGGDRRRAERSAPLMVVLLLPARSADPPHSSGSFGATALSTAPNAARVASALEPGSQCGRSASQPSGSSLGQQPVQQRLAFGLALRPGVELAAATPRGLPCRGPPARGCARARSSRTSNVLSGSKPRIFLTSATSSAPSAAPCALPVFILVRRRVADDGAQRDERRLVGDCLGGLHCFFYADHVLAALDDLHVPAVGRVAGRGVLAQRDVGVVLDGDLVVVVEHDQVAELLGAGQRRRLATSRPPRCRRRRRSHRCSGRTGWCRARRPDRTGRARSATPSPSRPRSARPWPSGPVVISTPGVWRNSGWPGVLDPQVRSDSMSDSSRPKPPRYSWMYRVRLVCPADSTKRSRPSQWSVARVVAHLPLEQRVRQRRQAHRGPGMTVADLLHRVRRQHPDRVDRGRIQLGPVVRVIRAGEGRNLFDCGHEAHSLIGRLGNPHHPP